MLQRFRTLFNLPSAIRGSISKGEYDLAVREYRKAKSIVLPSHVQMDILYFIRFGCLVLLSLIFCYNGLLSLIAFRCLELRPFSGCTVYGLQIPSFSPLFLSPLLSFILLLYNFNCSINLYLINLLDFFYTHITVPIYNVDIFHLCSDCKL